MTYRFDPQAVRITRHRPSTTQGEVSVYYAGQFFGRFFDEITLPAGGEWVGQDDAHWLWVAETLLKCRMEAKPEGNLNLQRPDGVEFVANTHSPNGTPFEPGWAVTAHNRDWASVCVGRFATLAEVSGAIDSFVMPEA